jgi:D-aminoacyl-tRNA deacylase
MKAVIQRVKRASVTVEGAIVGAIVEGMAVFLGVRNGDDETDAQYLANKICSMRIFEDADGKMNLSIRDVGGSVLVVSQFTLYGDTRKGNRPSFIEAAPPELAEQLYTKFVERCRTILGEERVATGVFRTMMDVDLINNGPVTLIVESKE